MDPIERHIKEHFDNKSFSYNEAHWLEAQKLIAENKRRRRGWLYWWSGGVTLILLSAVTYWAISDETRISTDIFAEETQTASLADPGLSKTLNGQSKQDTHAQNSNFEHPESHAIAQSSLPTFHDGSTSVKTSAPKTKSTYPRKIASTKKNAGSSESGGILKQTRIEETKSAGSVKNDGNSAGMVHEKEQSDNLMTVESIPEANEVMNLQNAEQLLAEEANSEVKGDVASSAEIPADNVSDESISIQPITPITKREPLSWGFSAGYLMQKQFTEDQWLKGAYFGARTNLTLASKWSIGTELSLVFQQIASVHYHHDVISGYGFGRDSIVTDMYAKRAITLQIPLAVSYAFGKHTFTGMIGSRILIDAQAKLEKLHYTNADPENTVTGAVVSRSTVLVKKEQLMPEGALAPFSIYSGIRYGWMIRKGWGLETNITIPLYHKDAKQDIGAKMAADQGIRIELGVMKVF